jgi:hypothetical protein
VLFTLTIAPPDGAAPLSWTEPVSASPLNGAVRVSVTDATVGPGPELTVKERAVDHAVTAAVLGELFPWTDRACQNFVPEVSDSTVRLESLSCGSNSSMSVNDEFLEISIS